MSAHTPSLKLHFPSNPVTFENLDFENEQLKGRLRGLEKELQARAEITDELNAAILRAKSHQHQSKTEYAAEEEARRAHREKVLDQSRTIEKLVTQQKNLEMILSKKSADLEELDSRTQQSDIHLQEAENQIAASTDQQESLQLRIEYQQGNIARLTAKQHGLEEELRSRLELTQKLELRIGRRRS